MAQSALAVGEECGTPRFDWICASQGAITVWKGSSAETAGSVSAGARRTMPPLTKVRAEAGAEGVIRFRKKASCELGPAEGPTEIVTRVDHQSLFRQTAGYTSCRSLDESFTPVGYFCEMSGECPVIFLSKGRFEASGPLIGGARASSLSYFRVEIDTCTRAFELRISGSKPRTIRRSTREPTLYHLEITLRAEASESPGGGSSSSSETFSLSEKSVSAPGICAQSFG
ncbi:MAG TPA: hypothetical protein VFX85_08350 [Solirubrobacterales bacterium]|nr:hypothetical protein [Solirubrobacterales bacterium]